MIGYTFQFLRIPFTLESNMCSPRFGLGDCSTICLPTPSGHSCACGYDIELLENGKSCENGKSNEIKQTTLLLFRILR